MLKKLRFVVNTFQHTLFPCIILFHTQKRTNIGQRLRNYEIVPVKDRFIFKRDGKFALHLNQVNQVVDLLHDTFGHMSVNAFKILFQQNFKAENFESKIFARFKDKDCDFCLEKRQFQIPKICKPIIVTAPWERCQVDLIDVAPPSMKHWGRTYRYLLSMIDCFSKYAWGFPVKSKQAKMVVPLIAKVFHQEGPPQILQSDRGKEFVNSLIQELREKHQFRQITSKPYAPWIQGVAERWNQTFEKLLRTKMQTVTDKSRWHECINEIVLKYNMTKHSSINHAPFEIFRRPFKNNFNPTTDLYTENLDICTVWLDPNSKKVLDHYRLSDSAKQFLRNQLISNVENYLKQRQIRYSEAFNQTSKRQSRNYFHNHLKKSQGHLFKVGERVAIRNELKTSRKSKKQKVTQKKFLFGTIKEIGINGDLFCVECKDGETGKVLLFWVKACAKIPQQAKAKDSDADFDLEMTDKTEKSPIEVNLTVDTFRIHVNSFVTTQRQIWKNEKQQVKLLKNVVHTDEDFNKILAKLSLPTDYLSELERVQQLMNAVWSSRFVEFYENLVAKSLPFQQKSEFLSLHQQNVVMKKLLDEGFKFFNDSLVKWNLNACTSGTFLFRQCLSIQESRAHDCYNAITQAKVLKNYWCCQVLLSKIFVKNNWSVVKTKNQNPFFGRLPKPVAIIDSEQAKNIPQPIYSRRDQGVPVYKPPNYDQWMNKQSKTLKTFKNLFPQTSSVNLMELMQSNHAARHSRIYSLNGHNSCWILSTMFGLAHCQHFRKSLGRVFLQVAEQNTDLKSTVGFHLSFISMVEAVLHESWTQEADAPESTQAKIKEGFKHTLNYLENWLQQQGLKIERGGFRDTSNALFYTGFQDSQFLNELKSQNCIGHEMFEFIFCNECISHEANVSALNHQNMEQIQKERCGEIAVDEIVSNVDALLCGNRLYTTLYTCATCKSTNYHKFCYRQPVAELVVKTRDGFSTDFALQELNKIPLIDFRLRQHSHQCTHFIHFDSQRQHFILYLIDWDHKIAWKCDTLSPHSIACVSMNHLQQILPQVTTLFMKKIDGESKLSSTMTHFQIVAWTKNTLVKILKVKYACRVAFVTQSFFNETIYF